MARKLSVGTNISILLLMSNASKSIQKFVPTLYISLGFLGMCSGVYLGLFTTGIKTSSFREVRKSSLGTWRICFSDDIPDNGWCSNTVGWGKNNPGRVSVVVAGYRTGVADIWWPRGLVKVLPCWKAGQAQLQMKKYLKLE